MKEFIISEAQSEKAVLVGLVTPQQNEQKVKEYLDELAFLADTAGVEPVKKFWQKLDAPNSVTFVGSGKLQEIKEYVVENEIGIVIFDDELSAKQLRNIEKELQVKILDRTNLILDIFALHAKTNEAKLQVKLAQNRYFLPKLRQVRETSNKYGGAGVGMRGPGETKLELDRRRLEREIDLLKKEIGKIKSQRQVGRREREKSGVKRVALVGYTNAGKSSLLNALTKENVYVENKYFATLDTTSRKLFLNGENIVITDTVGFISELPHELVDSFASTLDEARESDLVLHIVDPTATSKDGSENYFQESMRVTNKVLDDIGATSNRLVVYNKCDLLQTRKKLAENEIYVSAKTKEGLDALKQKIAEMLKI